jgi:hypothetical protein
MQVSGVDYDINWRAFTRGKSLFFPCLDYGEARREMFPVLQRLQLEVVCKGVIDPESGVKGLRIWRM